MANENTEIVLKLSIDNKDYEARIAVSKQEMVELAKATGISEKQLLKSFEEMQKGMDKTAASVDKIKSSFEKVEPAIKDAGEEGKQFGYNLGQDFDGVNVTLAELSERLDDLKERFGAAAIGGEEYNHLANEIQVVQGHLQRVREDLTETGEVTNTTTAQTGALRSGVTQVGWALRDLDPRLGSVVQGLSPFINGFNTASMRGGGFKQTLTAITSQLTGPLGIGLAITAAALLMRLFATTTEDTTEAIKEQKEAVKKLADEYKRLSTTQLESERQSLENRKAAIEAQIEELNKRKETVTVPAAERSGKPTTITKFKYAEDETRYKQLTEGVGIGDERVPGLNEINLQLRKLDEIAYIARQRLQLILGGSYDLSSINNVTSAIEVLNREIDAATSDAERAPLIKMKKQLDELLKSMGGEESKDALKFADSLKKALGDILKIKTEKEVKAEVSKVEFADLYIKLEEALNDYDNLLDQFKTVQNEKELAALQLSKEIMEKRIDLIKNEIDNKRKAMEEEKKMNQEITSYINKADADYLGRRSELRDKYYEKVRFLDENYLNYKENLLNKELEDLRTAGMTEIEIKNYTIEALREIEGAYYDWKREKFDEDYGVYTKYLTFMEAGYDTFFNTITAEQLTGKDRWSMVWDSMKQSFVSTLAEMLKQYIITTVIELAITKKAHAANVASATATGGAIAAAYAPAAALASIATLGGAAIAGSAGIASTVALSYLLAKPIIPGFEEGGVLPQGKIGFFEGKHRELVAPEKDFISVVNDLVGQTQIAMNQAYITGPGGGNNRELLNKIDLLTEKIESLATRPSRAFLDNDEAMKIGDHYDYETRRSIG